MPPEPAWPPVAKRVPFERSFHGDTVVDHYAWLLDREDADTLAYLEAENAYNQAATAQLGPLREKLFGEIKARTQETDLSVPARKGPWWYYVRTVEGSQYGIQCRRADEHETGAEEILVDFNEVAGSSDYLGVGAFDVSPDHRLVAYSVDFDGDETFTIRIKDLGTGEHLADEIAGTSYGTAWSLDGSVLFYTTLDEARRPYRVWRHRLGTPSSEDEMVHEEPDERFFASVELTRSDQFVVLHLASMVTSEAWVLPSGSPDEPFRVVAPRSQGVEYTLDHQGERFVVVSNRDYADFVLYEAPVASPSSWEPLWAPGAGVRIKGVDALARHLVVHHRRDGLTALRVFDTDSGDSHEIDVDEAVYTVAPGDNPEYDTSTYRFAYTSLVTPSSVYDYDIDDRSLTLRKRQPVLGDFDPTRYESVREWATAADGTRIPISLVRRVGTAQDGSAPCVLSGYGAYEYSLDPYFSIARLCLLDRGVVVGLAHVRGGGELGRRWYDDGKLLAKRNTFTDFVACAEHLVGAGYASGQRLAARGASAGGLLMGALVNLAPERFRAIVAEVPFVDALTTILDPSLPLTVIEWEEWGNPGEDVNVYEYMKSYSPVENVTGASPVAILVTAGLNDPRVGYHEPAKWVARLRDAGSADVLLKTELGAGHGGPSGRYDAWRDEAYVLAWLLDRLGVT